jgi:rubrerythrin
VKSFETVNDALDFAIAEEQGAVAFYTELAGKTSQSGIRDLLLSFAEEEDGHRKKLLEIKSGKLLIAAESQVRDLKIADYMTDVEPSPEVTYQEALIIAMKKEKAAFIMYNDLAAAAPNTALREVFEGLAHEEANHKLRFEVEYDSEIMREN